MRGKKKERSTGEGGRGATVRKIKESEGERGRGGEVVRGKKKERGIGEGGRGATVRVKESEGERVKVTLSGAPQTIRRKAERVARKLTGAGTSTDPRLE